MSWASRLTNTRACFSCSRSVTSNERARSFPSSNTHPFRLCYSIGITSCLSRSCEYNIRSNGLHTVPYLSLSFVRNYFQVPFRKHYKLKTNKRVRRLPSVLFSITSARPSLRKKRLIFFSPSSFVSFFPKKDKYSNTSTSYLLPLSRTENFRCPSEMPYYCIPYLRRYPWRIIHFQKDICTTSINIYIIGGSPCIIISGKRETRYCSKLPPTQTCLYKVTPSYYLPLTS